MDRFHNRMLLKCIKWLLLVRNMDLAFSFVPAVDDWLNADGDLAPGKQLAVLPGLPDDVGWRDDPARLQYPRQVK